MLDRECKDDLPALVTKVSRRQRRTDEDTESVPLSGDSAAVIIRRNSSQEAKKLPLAEEYNEQKKARNPYLCVPCNKKFAKSSLSSHVKSKHRGKSPKVKCGLCDKVFDRATKAQDHVSSAHKVYVCKNGDCGEAFSEFDKLKAHLKASHEGSEWPWICGFCDLVLLYDLEFEIHIKQHTEKPPFACPICSRLFSDNSRLREHLARQHLPSKEAGAEQPQSSAAQIKFEKQQAQLAQHQLQAFEKLKSTLGTMTDKGKGAVATSTTSSASSATASSVKDEAAVSRELAALLLNLHDSNGRQQQHQHPVTKVDNFPKAEDLSLKSSVETAIDLTKSKPEITLTPTMPASITKLVKGQTSSSSSSTSSGVTVTKTSVKAPSYPASAASNSYPFSYPSLAASMTSLSPTLAMNSNYLLHNLLLGKFQQIANGSNGSSTSSPPAASTASTATTVSSNMALPTHPLPAQTLSLPASKPPASVLKSATSPNGTSSAASAAVAAAAAAGYNLQLLSEATGSSSSSSSNGSIDIPYMCRQIVTLLNALLFHQHNLNNPTVEMNVHTQLGAIYTRLQEVVVMVEQAKKQQEAAKAAAAAVAKKEEKHLKDTKQKDEEKIAKQLHEYQRLLKQHENNDTTNAAVDLLKKAQPHLEAVIQQQVDVVDSMEDSSDHVKNRRRGRPPKNSNMDLSYSPPEKKLRSASDIQPSQQQPESSSTKYQNGETSPTVAAAVAAVASHLNGVASTNGGNSGSKGGKGIRNRVFCGECTGCLKNDDCGKCRYCKDKTKFGGQNRLRQKCLHRRCQLDTHRRRPSQNNSQHHNGGGGGHVGTGNSSFSDNVAVSRQSPSPDAIYSGVALARLASQSNLVVDTDVKEASGKNGQLSPGEIIRSSGQPVFPQAAAQIDDSRMTTNPLPSRAQQRSGSSASNASDEDTDDHKSGRPSQSRIDKWKAKHEAMLKMANSDKKKGPSSQDLQDQKSASSEDETVDIQAACLQSLTKQLPPPPAALSVK